MPNAFIQIAPNNEITIVINKLEMGQGVNTSLAQFIAEELDCDWKQIRSVSAPVAPVYNHTMFGTQMTGEVQPLILSFDQHRKSVLPQGTCCFQPPLKSGMLKSPP